jgi:hypothetical protein
MGKNKIARGGRGLSGLQQGRLSKRSAPALVNGAGNAPDADSGYNRESHKAKVGQ